MFVLGTAGHVDHGKSLLVKALTGIDPDRLPEEKERGMTLDLGFAWLRLPSGREVSIVDVPGHERFIKNMLAGVGGIDLALLVIAADEGIMPQTREHLAILNLLQVSRGVVAITKKDLVEEDWLELVKEETGELLKDTSLAQAPILALSSVTGEGIPELLSALDRLLDAVPPKKDIGRPRLPIDRVFTITGFGTVVTGTLIDGALSQGQEIELVPPQLKARLRGLETHKKKVEKASPGSRVAANLSGIAFEEVKRGQVLTTPGWLKPSRALDCQLKLLPSLTHPLSHNAPVSFHLFTSEVVGKVRLLDREQMKPGEEGWAQILLAQPVAAVKGDFFILRSTQETLGGGEIVEPHALRHRRFQSALAQSLATRMKGSAREVLLSLLEAKEPLEQGVLLSTSNIASTEAAKALQALLEEKEVVLLGEKGSHGLLLSAQGWERVKKKAATVLQDYHRQFPLRRGMPKEELRNRLAIPPSAFAAALERLASEKVLMEEHNAFRLTSYEPRPAPEQQKEAEAFLASLARTPYTPPTDSIPTPELLGWLVEQHRVVKVAEGVIFSAQVYDDMVRQVTERIKSQGKITVAEVRDLFHTSRKYALALMEHLDEEKITRRVGDERVLR